MNANETNDTNGKDRRRIFHVSSRENIKELRDEILRLHGFEVASTVYYGNALEEVSRQEYDLVMIDVDAEKRVESAQDLCDAIKRAIPEQHVVFVCNYRVAIESDCPDDIIRAEFNPEALVQGVQQALEKS